MNKLKLKLKLKLNIDVVITNNLPFAFAIKMNKICWGKEPNEPKTHKI